MRSDFSSNTYLVLELTTVQRILSRKSRGVAKQVFESMPEYLVQSKMKQNIDQYMVDQSLLF